MDSILGACLALTALSLIISTHALLAARRAEKRSAEFLEWKASLTTITKAPPVSIFPNAMPCAGYGSGYTINGTASLGYPIDRP